MTRTDVDDDYLTDLLNGFKADLPGVNHAIVVAGDGLLLANTGTLERDQAERIAAAAAGFAGLANQVDGELLGGGLQSITVELSEGYVLITQTPGGARLAAVVRSNTDIGQVVYQLGLLSDRVGKTALAVAARNG
ncbi:roadblock/LC7 domain-containing protein [Catellatospora methionotrophica]|uniref:roadblock/LC7 domain-containing protein n=1 Tax=Catellatospora methionotrophica TaxID=121620 RepID=UPI0033C8782E